MKFHILCKLALERLDTLLQVLPLTVVVRLHVALAATLKQTVFGASDVHELVALLAEAPGTHCTLPKVRAMLASRACRSAVMIGTHLDRPKMHQLVHQLATLDQPWNCPHGRPTLRHLVDLKQLAATPAALEFERTRWMNNGVPAREVD